MKGRTLVRLSEFNRKNLERQKRFYGGAIKGLGTTVRDLAGTIRSAHAKKKKR